MNGGKADCVADTSAIIRLLRRNPQTVAVMRERTSTITFITVAELYLGVLKTNNWELAVERLNDVLPEQDVLYPTDATAAIYARICHELELRGSRIPTNDIWIAALALENDLPLVGRDEHFTRIEGLQFISC